MSEFTTNNNRNSVTIASGKSQGQAGVTEIRNHELSEEHQVQRRADLIAWRNRIRCVQIEKAPEMMEVIRARSERSRRAQQSYKSVSRMERINYLASLNNQQALVSYSNDAASSNAIKRSEVHSMNSNRLKRLLLPAYPNIEPATSRVGYNVECIVEEADEEEELERIESELASDVPYSVDQDEPITQDRLASDIDSLLVQLIDEPTNDIELTAKFSLFENFLDGVAALRSTLLEFWETNKDQFDRSLYREIERIDRHDQLGFVEDPSKWFVYQMTQQANNNSKLINSVLSTFKARLSLLAQDLGECPCCLDQLTQETQFTLACCHRLCHDCWANWKEIKRDQVFCPMCNHSQFVYELSQEE